MIAWSDNYGTGTSSSTADYHTCPSCGHNFVSRDYDFYVEPAPFKPEPDEPEILQHIHLKLFQKQIGNLVQYYVRPLYNRKLLFCASGYLPKRIKRIRKS